MLAVRAGADCARLVKGSMPVRLSSTPTRKQLDKHFMDAMSGSRLANQLLRTNRAKVRRNFSTFGAATAMQ
jgi:hypothetical protein